MKTIYIAGPMSGIAQLNFPAFNAEAARLRALGHAVINPAEINGDDPEAVAAMSAVGLAQHWRNCMRADITALMTCDAISMLPGWEHSKGATIEHYNARSLGFDVIFAEDAQ